jgi:large subunit ribosomal protein L25
MATQTRLEAEPRLTFGNHNRGLRRGGKLPANIFGFGESVAVQVDMDTFRRLRMKHQTTGLIELSLNGKVETVLVRHIAHEPSTGKMLHVDFQRVRMNEPIHAKVLLHVVGDSEVAKQTGGIVLPLLEAVEIEALPGDLPDAVTVDAGKLTSADTILHAGDIDLPKGVKLLTSEDEAILKIQPPRVAEEEVPAAEAAPTEAAESPAEEAES